MGQEYGFFGWSDRASEIFWFWNIDFLVLVHYPKLIYDLFCEPSFLILSLKINWQMFQFTEQLIYFTNKHTYPGDHCNSIYSILRKKSGRVGVDGPNQVKNEFLIFFHLFTCWHLLLGTWLPVFQKGLGLHYL